MVRFDFGPLLQGQTRKAKLKSAHNLLIIGRTIQEIMGRESFGVVRFDLGPLLQGQTRIPKLKSAYISLIIVSPTRSGDTMDSSSLSSAPSSASAEISC